MADNPERGSWKQRFNQRATGAQVSSGTGAPTDDDGLGSMYMRFDTGAVYQKTAAGVNGWTLNTTAATQATGFAGSIWGSPAATLQQGDTALTANVLYENTIWIGAACTLTGIQIPVGSVNTGNVMVALWDSTGAALASCASTALGSTFTQQLVPFTTPYAVLAPGSYIVSAVPSSSAAKFYCAVANSPASAPNLGSFVLPASITPPANTARTTAMGLATY